MTSEAGSPRPAREPDRAAPHPSLRLVAGGPLRLRADGLFPAAVPSVAPAHGDDARRRHGPAPLPDVQEGADRASSGGRSSKRQEEPRRVATDTGGIARNVRRGWHLATQK